MGNNLNREIADAADLDEAVHLAVGAASMCWGNVGLAGVFDSDRAHKIALELEAWIEQHRPGKSLGTVYVDVVPRIGLPVGETVELEGGPVPDPDGLALAEDAFVRASVFDPEAPAAAPATEADRRWNELCEGLGMLAAAFSPRRTDGAIEPLE